MFFETRSEHITTSKTFRDSSIGAPVAYTVAIRAIRVMSSGGGHAQVMECIWGMGFTCCRKSTMDWRIF